MQKEPAAILGLVGAATASVLALLIAFGIDLAQSQQVAILGVIAGAGPLLVAAVTRSKVFAPANVVVALADKGLVAGPAGIVAPGTPVAVTPVTP